MSLCFAEAEMCEIEIITASRVYRVRCDTLESFMGWMHSLESAHARGSVRGSGLLKASVDDLRSDLSTVSV